MAEEEKPSGEAAENAEVVDESIKKKSDGSEGAQKAPAPKLIYIVLALNLVVLLALAVFVWMNLSKSQKQVSLADIEASKAPEAHAAAGGEHSGGEGEKGGEGAEASSKFIPESFKVNLADSTGSHFAIVDVEIEVEDDFVKEEVVRLRPRIRDFIVVILSSKTYDQIASIDGRDFLREEIRNKINGYLTRGQIKNVYFTQFIIQ
ncbi:MAG: flagellar basal body-associated FliL family protein [Bdellovibrionota bacterium]